MGPDEYHDVLPRADRPGLDDNAYTTVLTAWLLGRAQDCLDILPPGRRHELLDTLDVTNLQSGEATSFALNDIGRVIIRTSSPDTRRQGLVRKEVW